MALVDNAWYVNFGNGTNTGYYAVTPWAANTAIAAGALYRQNTAPTLGNERVFVCIVAGTTHATTEPTWTVTRGGKTTDNTVTWQECTGIAALNGDATNTPDWTTIKNTAVSLGQVIKRNNGASYQICTTAGTAGNGAEPGFSDTAGTTTADNTVTWTSLGAVGNFTGWQAPHNNLRNAFTANWGAAGNVFYVASEHAETRSVSLTLTSPGTLAAPCKILCVNKNNVPPTSANLTTGATISTTGTTNIDVSGAQAYYRGIEFKAGSSTGVGSLFLFNTAGAMVMDTCGLTLNNSASTSKILLCGSNGLNNPIATLKNCTFNFGGATAGQAGQSFGAGNSGTNIRILGGSVVVSTNVPTSLFASLPAYLYVEGLDMSALGSGTTIAAANALSGVNIFKDCKLGASVTKAATPTSLNQRTIFIRSDSAATNYLHEVYTYAGTQIVETTVVRTGGASDGTTPVSWKIDTTANATWAMPFESTLLPVWNETTGSSVTVTVYGIWGGGAVPNNDEIWIEAEYLGNASYPIGSIVTSTKADILASGSGCTSDSSTWGGSTTKFKLTATFTPQMKGYVTVCVKAAKVSSTFYIDPKPVLS